MKPWRPIVVFTLGLCTLACKEGPFDELEILPPVSTREGLVYIDRTHHEALFVTPSRDDVEIEHVAVGEPNTVASWYVPTGDGSGVLVLTQPESEKHEDVVEQLHLLAEDGQPVRTWDVHAPFTDIALSPDFRRAVLFFGESATGATLHNANQIAIVDLQSDDVRGLTLNGFGALVQRIQFPGQRADGEPGLVDVGGRARDLVAFLADGEVVLVDAADPAADQVAVRFGDAAFAPEASMIRRPDALFADATLFLRGGGNDVAMLTLVDKPDELTGVSGFSTQVSLIPVGQPASDFTVFNSEAVPYLLTVGGAEIVFTDIRTQHSFAVMLEGPAQRVRMRQHETPTGPVTQAFAWAQGGTAIHTLVLDGVEDTLGRAPRQLLIETGIEDLVVLDNDRALIGSGMNLYIVDFRNEQVTPLRSSVTYDPRASVLTGDRLLLATPGQLRVSTVDLVTLDPESILLDEAIESLHFLPARQLAVVVHPHEAGYITVVDATDPSRANSRSFFGLFVEGLLER